MILKQQKTHNAASLVFPSGRGTAHSQGETTRVVAINRASTAFRKCILPTQSKSSVRDGWSAKDQHSGNKFAIQYAGNRYSSQSVHTRHAGIRCGDYGLCGEKT